MASRADRKRAWRRAVQLVRAAPLERYAEEAAALRRSHTLYDRTVARLLGQACTWVIRGLCRRLIQGGPRMQSGRSIYRLSRNDVRKLNGSTLYGVTRRAPAEASGMVLIGVDPGTREGTAFVRIERDAAGVCRVIDEPPTP